jgi:putative methyltransferase (TIGR04325 family)
MSRRAPKLRLPAIPAVRAKLLGLRPLLPTWLGGRGPFVGVHPSFDGIGEEHGADNDDWVQTCLAEASRLRDTAALERWQPKSWELEPLAVAMLGRSGPVRVVDFGGAIGFSYLLLKKRLAPAVALDYHIIETPAICEAGREFFAGDASIRFHDSDAFLDTLPPNGLLNIASSLQYVKDWREKLRSLLRWKPEWALFTQLTAGEQKTYASMQRNVPGVQLAHWFFSQSEVIAEVESNGYKLLYSGRCQNAVNQIHHEPSLQIGYYRNLLFARAS